MPTEGIGEVKAGTSGGAVPTLRKPRRVGQPAARSCSPCIRRDLCASIFWASPAVRVRHLSEGAFMDCPLCGVALAERGFFCKACAAQVRCKACRELLELDAVACVECGTRIGQPPAVD